MTVATGTPSSSPASAGREREDVGHHRVRAQRGDQRPRLAGRPHDRLVGLQRALARGEDVVLGRGLEPPSPRP